MSHGATVHRPIIAGLAHSDETGWIAALLKVQPRHTLSEALTPVAEAAEALTAPLRAAPPPLRLQSRARRVGAAQDRMEVEEGSTKSSWSTPLSSARGRTRLLSSSHGDALKIKRQRASPPERKYTVGEEEAALKIKQFNEILPQVG